MNKNTFRNNKYHPVVVKHFLERPSVTNLIENAIKKPITIVVAAAGYGKTQAVSATLKTLNLNSSWIQLSILDNHTDIFWKQIARSLDPEKQGLFESLMALKFPDRTVSFEKMEQLLGKEFNHNTPLVLVFDNFHLIHNKVIIDFIEFLISLCLKELSVVIISRKKPNLNLSRILHKGLLARITEKDLCFSKSQMDAFFSSQGFDINEDMSNELFSYTNGWICGIYLVSLAIEEGNLCPIQAAKQDLLDFIEQEVFEPISMDLKNLLTKIVLFDCIPTILLKELAYGNSNLIYELKSLSIFIKFDAFSNNYYIQPLFREFILEKTDNLSEKYTNEVYLLAAKCFEKNNQIVDAIQQYRNIQCYQKVLDIICRVKNHVPKQVALFFIELIEQTPKDLLICNPMLPVVKAKYLLNNNQIYLAKKELLSIKKEYENLPKTKGNLAILGETTIFLALISVINTDYEFKNLFQKACIYLPDGSNLIDRTFIVAEGLNFCSIKNSTSGAIKKHQALLFETVPLMSKVMNGCGCGLEYLSGAEFNFYTGDLKEAEKYAHRAIYESRSSEQYDVEYMAYFILIRVFTAQGNHAKILKIFNIFETKLQHIESQFPFYDIIKGWFLVKNEMTDKVPKWIADELYKEEIIPPLLIGREYMVASDYLLCEERYYELWAFMKQTDEMYESRGILFAILQNKIIQAISYHYTGNRTEALNYLNEAYLLAHPNNLIMQFVEYGKKMRTVIRSAKRSTQCVIPKEWLDKIYVKSSSYAKQVSHIKHVLNEVNLSHNTKYGMLSKRESEVLSYLYRGLTRIEIADNCFLSLSSINSILKSIYEKLGASNSLEAIRMAKDIGLL